MMAATLSALGRLTFGLRGRPQLEHTLLQVFTTVLALLHHNAHEVVKAAISYIKVGLYAFTCRVGAPIVAAARPADVNMVLQQAPASKDADSLCD